MSEKSSQAAFRSRPSTKGPLDDADPLTSMAIASPQSSPQFTGRSVAPTRPIATFHRRDFSYLLRPEIYHSLPPIATPAPFGLSSNQPSPNTPLTDLIARGHFRAAAISAAQALTATSPDGSPTLNPSDCARIFALVYARLACLILADATPIAAQEARSLEDLANPARYVDETGIHVAPWELRVLNVRLQALGFGDPRRAVMGYYGLAREARERLATLREEANDNAERRGVSASVIKTWMTRLHDLGMRVAGALVEMGDLPGAAEHLETLRYRGDKNLELAKALLWLHIGDAARAKQCVGDGRTGAVLAALHDMANGKYELALAKWEEIDDEDEMMGVNKAVCLLYLAKIDESRGLLERLVASGHASRTLLFNLTTMYELCTERHRELKLGLAEKVAGLPERPSGWEKSTVDFKM